MGYVIEKLAVLGLGTLGAQIALQAAASGYHVSAFDPDETVFKRSLEAFVATDQPKIRPSTVDIARWPEVVHKIKMVPSLAEAVSQADLVIEAVPENLDLKLKVWREMGKLAPDHAILATNSSSMPVSKLEAASGRPEKCLNLHFYQMIFGQNMADLMGGTGTAQEVLESGREFVKSMGIVPLQMKKELLGFCFNRVWRAVKREALYMWANSFVDFHDIDRAWMIFTGTDWGPFGLMDAVGLDVVWDIEMVYYRESQDPKDHPPQALKEMIDTGQLGVKTGRGFYLYPDPEFRNENFLNP